MGSFTCCIWWLVFGVLLGWLLSWWLSKYFGNSVGNNDVDNDPPEIKPSLREIYFSDTIAPKPAVPETPEVVSPGLSREEMLSAASAAGISFSGKNSDLEIIEGIGPKIAELLNESSIHTFTELSKASIATIELILEQGGERFKLANPSTWAEQARLAAENKWSELKALQDALDGGVEKS
jgi:predicted flap endonuclease-1-like 5' DNA nuclease